MSKLKIFIEENKKVLYVVFGLLGGFGGFVYYYLVGCNSGTCPITSNPYMSIIWGVLLGVLTLNLFTENKNEQNS
ncbi:MAG: hypothetical protein A2X12_01705 [Bacteroidetes bacterium GWE2_29_8]|nr:MAG: hypothetical protein A2X12_01705 [Bacteroidetes bacterium GWE2_29_8]OFY15365.1 MAG: hypothetical protein A2X02_02925 [Bacteroidetes bacterium GWF2_29_10]